MIWQLFSLAISHRLNVAFQLDRDKVAMTKQRCCEEGPAFVFCEYNDKNSTFITRCLATVAQKTKCYHYENKYNPKTYWLYLLTIILKASWEKKTSQWVFLCEIPELERNQHNKVIVFNWSVEVRDGHWGHRHCQHTELSLKEWGGGGIELLEMP